MLFALLSFWSCSDQEEGVDPSAMLKIYGKEYQLTSGVIWKNHPMKITTKEPYVYEDTYVNAEGQEVTDRITGFKATDEQTDLGNFMLSLYEDGLSLNENLGSATGRAACVCFHLNSENVNELSAGKYVYGMDKKAFSFVGYYSSDYDALIDIKPGVFSEGEITVEKNGDQYKVVFHCKTSFGGEISGEYQGKLSIQHVAAQANASANDITLAGLLDTVKQIQEVPSTGQIFEIITPDTYNGAAFFSSALSTAQVAEYSNKEMTDIALVWDKEKSVFRFESPVRMRSLLGHDDAYNFLCHTIYMKAPADFTDADYESLGNNLPVQVTEEKVEISTENFTPQYVFFQTGTGVQGAIRINGFSPLGAKVEDWFGMGMVFIYTPINPALKIDIKYPATFVNPSIR